MRAKINIIFVAKSLYNSWSWSLTLIQLVFAKKAKFVKTTFEALSCIISLIWMYIAPVCSREHFVNFIDIFMPLATPTDKAPHLPLKLRADSTLMVKTSGPGGGGSTQEWMLSTVMMSWSNYNWNDGHFDKIWRQEVFHIIYKFQDKRR